MYCFSHKSNTTIMLMHKNSAPQDGFITMIILMVVIMAFFIFLAYKRVITA